MKLLDLTLPTPAQNLACDEALLGWCEDGGAGEILRFWESSAYFVTLGYTNRVAQEAHENTVVPILRRCSGGGTVLQGPGCFNYSLILRVPQHGPTASVTGANEYIMQRHRDALQTLFPGTVSVEGHTDLAYEGRKFSGNAQRRKQKYFLFHGTFLLDFDLTLIERVLRPPPKQPQYRQDRNHTDFVMNLPLSQNIIKSTLCRVWEAFEPLQDFPRRQMLELAEEKYSQADWNLKF